MIILSLGSNLTSIYGDRFETLKFAIFFLESYGIIIKKKSSFYESESFPNKKNPKFINIIISVKTDLPPVDLMSVLIHIEKNASAQLIENYNGADDTNSWAQNVTTVKLDENASLEIYQFQDQGNETIHMSETLVDVSAEAQFKHYSLNIGAALSRTEIKPTLKGEKGKVELYGAFLARSGKAHDVFTHMKHMAPECDSNQIYRGVLDKGGKSAFQGKVYVAKDAQLTNADQSNKNLILDRNAEANSKPELLIYADDVKCSHGTTVGELDGEALFYLKSRGLDHLSAKALMVEAFVADVYQDIETQAVKEKYLALAREWLAENE